MASFAYVGTTVGIDTIEATFVDALGRTQRSNRVTKDWVEAPDIDAGDDAEGNEGSPITLLGFAEDPAEGNLSHEWTYTAGADVDDGATCIFSAPTLATTDITCTDDGTYTATLTATSDASELSASDSAVVTVQNVAPTVTIDIPDEESDVRVAESLQASASFTDPGSNDTHNCSIDWGDNTVDTGSIANGDCTGSHAFGAAGSYTITVAVSDDDGGTGVDSITITVVDQPPPPPLLCPNGDAADVVVDFPTTMKLFLGDTVERSVTQTVPAGIYRVILGSSDVGRGGQIQDHEQWRAKLGDVTTGFSDDLPDDPLTDVVGHTTHLPGTITVPVGVTEVTVQHWSTEPGNVDDTNPANSVIPEYLCLIASE
jgi:PKD repeat protein